MRVMALARTIWVRLSRLPWQDKNGDGRISKKEWGQSIAANRTLLKKYFGSAIKGTGGAGEPGSPPTSSLELHDLKEIGKAFKRLDSDNSGDLTWEEVRVWRSRCTALRPICLRVDLLAS